MVRGSVGRLIHECFGVHVWRGEVHCLQQLQVVKYKDNYNSEVRCRFPLTAPAQKISLGHHACLGGKGACEGRVEFKGRDGLGTDVDMVTVGVAVVLAEDGAVVDVEIELAWGIENTPVAVVSSTDKRRPDMLSQHTNPKHSKVPQLNTMMHGAIPHGRQCSARRGGGGSDHVPELHRQVSSERLGGDAVVSNGS